MTSRERFELGERNKPDLTIAVFAAGYYVLRLIDRVIENVDDVGRLTVLGGSASNLGGTLERLQSIADSKPWVRLIVSPDKMPVKIHKREPFLDDFAIATAQSYEGSGPSILVGSRMVGDIADKHNWEQLARLRCGNLIMCFDGINSIATVVPKLPTAPVETVLL